MGLHWQTFHFSSCIYMDRLRNSNKCTAYALRHLCKTSSNIWMRGRSKVTVSCYWKSRVVKGQLEVAKSIIPSHRKQFWLLLFSDQPLQLWVPRCINCLPCITAPVCSSFGCSCSGEMTLAAAPHCSDMWMWIPFGFGECWTREWHSLWHSL